MYLITLKYAERIRTIKIIYCWIKSLAMANKSTINRINYKSQIKSVGTWGLVENSSTRNYLKVNI